MGVSVEQSTARIDATTSNNFNQFGTDKVDPANNAHSLNVAPWTLEIARLVEKPGRYALGDLHLLSYSRVDRSTYLADISRDITKRPFILVAFASFALLPATSFNRATRALGAQRGRNAGAIFTGWFAMLRSW